MAHGLGHSQHSTDDAAWLLGPSAGEQLPILAVDDRPENLVALQAVLAPLGFEVITARSGEETLRLLLERDFALILLDVRMPGTDGLETARLIKERERTREVPIVFLTAARDEVSDMVRGYGVGAVDYVLKPFDEELLRSKVAVFAELEHRRRALRRSEALLRGAFEAAPIGKTLLDGDRRIVRANPAFARMLARDQTTLSGMAIDELCHPEDRASLAPVLGRTAWADSETDVTSALGGDMRLLTAHGHEQWVAPTASWVEGTEYTAPLLLVQWVDVNARRHAEGARAELLLEQAARAQAEAQAARLEKLQRLAEALRSPSLEDLLAEVARRLVDMFEADAGEVDVRDGGEGQPVLSASGAHVRRAHPELATDTSGRWEQAALTAEGAVIGTLRVALAPGRTFTAFERALLREAASQISLLVRRMQLHEREHRIAIELQRGLLPTRLPELPGVELAAHYQAAGLGAEVGGDWYDAFLLPGNRLGLVIGDVTGSGIKAASAMGQLRSVARAFALGDPEPPSPAEVLTRMQRYHQKVGFEQLFTILYLILDQAAGSVSWANAAHPPPLLRTAGGEILMLEGTHPLMSLRDTIYEDRRATIDEGDTLILYTDGLIERRGEPIDTGLKRLQDAIREGPQEPQALCAYLLDSAPRPDTDPDDDVTALVVRVTPGGALPAVQGEGERRLRITLAPDVTAPGLARKMLERGFGKWLEPEELERAKLSLSELATNAVVHGEGELTVLAELDDTRLLVEVIDQGSGFEHVVREREFDTIGGHGLNIVDAESSRWGMHEGTTHVWFEIERRGPRLGADQRPER